MEDLSTIVKFTARFLVLLGLLVTMSHTVRASDPDLTTDFDVTNPTVINFTFSGFRNPAAPQQGQAAPIFANLPGLTGLGLTAALFEFGAQSQIDPHVHPRGTEIFYVTSGQVDVGFVDTNNDLFETTLQAGDLFVFPKGLLHWQRNNCWETASGFSAISSENPGTLFAAKALFTGGTTGLPDIVLSTALGTSAHEVDSLKRSVAARNA